MPFSCFFGRMSILSAILKGVSAPLCKREVNELIYLTVDEEEIITTEKHPFYVKDRGFVSAGKLKPGDEVLLSDGTTAKIRKVEEHHLETPVCVYNFEVEELHTYLVGAKGIVVHNDCAEPVPEGGSKYGIDVDNLDFSNTVSGHGNRPYQYSKLLINEIINSSEPIQDPQGTNALYWEVDGSFNNSNGTYELLIDPETNTVWHFVYKSK